MRSGGGIFGPLARAQYAALARLRWQMFMQRAAHQERARWSWARAPSRLLSMASAGSRWAGARPCRIFIGRRQSVEVPAAPVLGSASSSGSLFPIMLASFQEQFDLGILLRFPVRFGSYFLALSGLRAGRCFDDLGGLCCTGVLVGIALARPTLFAWTTLALMIFAAFNILLVRAIFAWIDRWLAQRKTREILGAIFMVADSEPATAESRAAPASARGERRSFGAQCTQGAGPAEDSAIPAVEGRISSSVWTVGGNRQ